MKLVNRKITVGETIFQLYIDKDEKLNFFTKFNIT